MMRRQHSWRSGRTIPEGFQPAHGVSAFGYRYMGIGMGVGGAGRRAVNIDAGVNLKSVA